MPMSGWNASGEPPAYFSAPGSYPTKDDGIVSRTVCFDNSLGGQHCIAHATINALNCGDEFFLWQLPDAPTCAPKSCCSRAYCTAESGIL